MVDEVEERRTQALDERACWERLASQQIGRLAFRLDGRFEVLPLNFVAPDRRVLLRTAAGSPVDRAVDGEVAFEVDSWDAREAWSVVARGTLRRVGDPGDVSRAERLAFEPWPPHDEERMRLLEVASPDLQGRRFDRRPQPHVPWSW